MIYGCGKMRSGLSVYETGLLMSDSILTFKPPAIIASARALLFGFVPDMAQPISMMSLSIGNVHNNSKNSLAREVPT